MLSATRSFCSFVADWITTGTVAPVVKLPTNAIGASASPFLQHFAGLADQGRDYVEIALWNGAHARLSVFRFRGACNDSRI